MNFQLPTKDLIEIRPKAIHGLVVAAENERTNRWKS